MNAVISNVVRAQASNSSAAVKLDQETLKSAEQVTGGLNTAAETSVSSKYDTLDLSREYLKYKTQGENKALHDQTNQLNSTLLQYAVADKQKKPVYNYQLFSYTESELLEKLRNGEITPDEYKNEMSSRDPDFSEAENLHPLLTAAPFIP